MDDATPTPRMNCILSDDHSEVLVEFLPASGTSGHMTLSLEQLTKMIGSLGRVRSAMLEGKPAQPLVNQKIDAEFNTQWFVQPETLTGGSSLFFDHPSYGPVGFVVPRDQVVEIVRLLSLQLTLPPSTGAVPN